MNKKQLLRDTIKRTPMCIHSLCTWGKIHQLEAIYLKPEEVSEGENSFIRKEQLVEESCRKHQKRSSRIKKAADKALNTSPLLKGRDDLEQLRTDILFCYFAYGYVPEEYVFYHFYDHRDEAYRRTYVSEIERLCCRYAMNDFTESSFSDKTVEYDTLKAFYGRDAVAVRSQSDFDAFSRFIKEHPVFVEKPAISSMGKGVRLVNIQKESVDPKKYFDNLERGGGYGFLSNRLSKAAYCPYLIIL